MSLIHCVNLASKKAVDWTGALLIAAAIFLKFGIVWAMMFFGFCLTLAATQIKNEE